MESGSPPPPSTVLRVLLAGDEGVGKTSLVKAFLSSKPLDQEELPGPTVGIELSSLPFQHLPTNQAIKLEIWDASGRERFRGIALSYMKPCLIIFLVYDVTKRLSFESLQRWLGFVNEQKEKRLKERLQEGEEEESYHIAIVGNKADRQADREVTEEEGNTFATTRGLSFLETSSLTGQNVREMFSQAVSSYPLRPAEEEAPLSPSEQGGAREQREDPPEVLVEFLLGETLPNVLDTISAEDLMKKPALIEKSGFIEKKGHVFKNWKNRWFILKDEYLYYFENPKSLRPKGFILLKNAEVFRYQDPERQKLGFKLVVSNPHTKNQVYFTAGLEQTEREEWMEVIKKVIDKCKAEKVHQSAPETGKDFVQLVLSPGSLKFKKVGFLKKKTLGTYPTRQNKLTLYSDDLLGSNRFFLADSVEYGTRFMLTPKNPEKLISFLKERGVHSKTKIPLMEFLDIFVSAYLNACQRLSIVPIQKIKMAISDCFSSKSLPSSISLSDLTLQAHELLPLSYAFGFVPTITSLDFSNTVLEEGSLEILHSIVSHPKALFSSFNFRSSFPNGIPLLVGSIIRDCPSLTHLDLSQNPLRLEEPQEPGKPLSFLSATFLTSSSSLSSILLEETSLTDELCPYLKTLFESLGKLRTISLKGNKSITSFGVDLLLEGLETSQSVVQCDLEGISLSSSQQEKLTRLLSRNLGSKGTLAQ